MGTIKLDLNNFDKMLNDSKKPILVDFYADWCGPCKMIAPILEEIGNENNDIEVCKINIDESPEIAQKYGVISIPTLVSFRNGEEYKRNVGAIPKNLILDLVDKH